MRNVLDKVVDKIKIYILSSITLQLKIMLFMRCGKIIARQATDDNIWCMYFAYWITKATDTHTHTHNMLYLLLFHGNNGYTNTLECYVYMYITCLVMLVSLTSKDSGPEQ